MSIQEINTKEPNQDVIDILNEQLELAKNGEIQSIAIASIMVWERSSNTFCALFDPIGLIGQLEVLKREIMDTSINLRTHNAGDDY